LETVEKNGGPIFRQLAKIISQRLIRGDLHPGDKLPSARDFAVLHQVNPNTVVACYKELELKNITETRRGLGTFIRADAPIEELRQISMSEIIDVFVKNIAAIGISVDEAVTAIKRDSK